MAETPQSAADFVCVLECKASDIDKRTGRPCILAKTIEADGSVTPYGGGFWYRAEHVPVSSLAELYEVLEALAGDPHRCIVRDERLENAEGVVDEWVPRRADEVKYGEGGVAFGPADHHWVAIDLDASVIALNPHDPRASIAEWRATLPAPLDTCGMIFHLSSKAHLSPYLRGHAWIWATEPVDQDTLKEWYPCVTDDPSLAHPVQIHFTADPVWAEGAGPDPYAGRRFHFFEGPDAAIDWAAVEVSPRPTRTVANAGAPDVPPDAGVLEVLGDANDHDGRRWHLCGALGGVWRRLGWSAAKAQATIEAWLDNVQGCDVAKGVERCLGAWSIPFDRGSGGAELARYLGGDAEWAERVAKASRPPRSKPAPSDTFTPVVNSLVGDLTGPPLLSAPKNVMYIRDDNGYFGPVPLGLMQGTLRAVGLQDILGRDRDGKTLRDEALYRSGAPVHTIVRSFEETSTRYDAEEFTLYQGYQLPDVDPVWSDAVHAWLAALSGDMLPNVLDWIALCSQAGIARRAAALVIIGEHSTGKSLIFKCLARMWGALGYVNLKDAAAQFNASICECPIVVDDECQALKARLISSEEFRERVQARQRKYEPKGFEKVHLLGYTREGIAANAVEEVTIARVFSASTREAIEARLCVVHVPDTQACRGALLAVAGGDQDAEVATIMGHLSWLWQNHEVKSTERFAASGGRGVHTVALAGVADDGAEVWDYLHSFLSGDGLTAPADESARPFMVRDGALLCYPQALAAMLAAKGGRWDAKTVGKVLGALRVGDRVQVKVGARVIRYWPLDFDRAIELAGVDREALIARL